MARFLKDLFPRIIQKLREIPFRAKEREYRDAQFAMEAFMRELRARQPVGELDQFALEFPEWRSEARPSRRQGNVPIEEGWHAMVEQTAEGSEIRISTESPHLQYFTRWTGRPWLGTRAGRRIAARNKKTLAFWWLGRAWFPQSVAGVARIRPESDFVQDAYDAIKDDLPRRGRDSLRELVIEAFRG